MVFRSLLTLSHLRKKTSVEHQERHPVLHNMLLLGKTLKGRLSQTDNQS